MELTLMIKFDQSNGQIGVACNPPDLLGNQLIAFGMLEVAKVAIVKQAEANERRVQPATSLPPGFPVQ